MSVRYPVPRAFISKTPVGSNSWNTPLSTETPGSGPVGLAQETDLAFALSGRQIRSVGLAQETDLAFALSFSTPGAVGLAQETDLAFALSGRQIRSVGLAQETDLAFALSAASGISVGLAQETDLAFALSGRQIRPVGLAQETDLAFALVSVGPAPIPPAFDWVKTKPSQAIRMTTREYLSLVYAGDGDTILFAVRANGARIRIVTVLSNPVFNLLAVTEYGELLQLV